MNHHRNNNHYSEPPRRQDRQEQEKQGLSCSVDNLGGRGSCRAVLLLVTRRKRRLAGRLALQTPRQGHVFYRTLREGFGRTWAKQPNNNTVAGRAG
jgi:hypothetical protein